MMDKLAYSTLPCEGWSVDQLIEACKTYGFTGVELREGTGYAVGLELSTEERTRIGAKFREAGITVTNLGSSFCIRGEAGDRAKLDGFREMAELAGQIGAAGIRIFLGNFAQRYDAPKHPIDHAAVVAWIQDACDIAEAHGVAVWIETHNEYATGITLRALLDEVGRPNCGVIYDIIHPIEDGEEPEQTIKLLGDQCVHIHLKDGVPSTDPMDHDWKYTMIGEGRLPLERILAQLERSGYRGYYSLEWESKWRKELQGPGLETETAFQRYIEFMKAIGTKESGQR